MTSISFLPPELILRILKRCDSLRQLLALSSSWKSIHSVFSSNIHSILRTLGTNTIIAFHDSLITVRATKIVVDHYHKGELPPDPFPLDSINDNQRISREEFISVLDLAHFVDCVENICLNNTSWGDECLTRRFVSPSMKRSWRENFHRSMYRALLLGPVMCRAYQEALTFDYDIEPHFPRLTGTRPTDQELEHMAEFPVLNFETCESHELVFGLLAGFLARQSKNRAQREQHPEDPVFVYKAGQNGLTQTETHTLYVETVECLFALMTLSEFCSESSIFQPASLVPYSSTNESTINEPANKEDRKTTIILFGQFCPAEISMPVRTEDACKTLMVSEGLRPKKADNSSRSLYPDLNWTLNLLLEFSGHLYDYPSFMAGCNDYLTPFPPLQLFQFICRKYLFLRLAEDAFAPWIRDSTVNNFMFSYDSGDIFFEENDLWTEGAAPMFEYLSDGD